MGQVVGEIDLRLFLRNWRYGYAFREEPEAGPRTGLLFFDAAGTAVHKIYGPTAALEGIVAAHADPEACGGGVLGRGLRADTGCGGRAAGRRGRPRRPRRRLGGAGAHP